MADALPASSVPPASSSLASALKVPARRRAAGLLIALALEALLFLALLTLGGKEPPVPAGGDRLTTFDVSPQIEAEPEPAPPEPSPPVESRAEPVPAEPAPTTPAPPRESAPLPPPAITLPQSPPVAVPPPAAEPSRPRQPAGPPAPRGGAFADSAVVGTAPNGERLYAAAWYREPYDEELRGYLSTADGPGWALIACRTVPDFKVDDCVGLDEYPSGSKIGRAVLAAAWQFRVRPPRLGGQLKVGEWVRIRIDYGIRRR